MSWLSRLRAHCRSECRRRLTTPLHAAGKRADACNSAAQNKKRVLSENETTPQFCNQCYEQSLACVECLACIIIMLQTKPALCLG